MQTLLKQFKQATLSLQVLAVGWGLIMLLLPFHAFISTWGGTTIGPLEAWKAWKEVLLALLVLVSLVPITTDPKMRQALWSRWYNKLIVIYGLLHIVSLLIVGNQTEPLVVGLGINLRIVSFFAVSQILFYYLKPPRRIVLTTLLAPFVGVVVVGLLQMFVLPYDYLAWFGYDKSTTIAPFHTIDQQLDQLRYMSTLRGPNPLGAYLILPLVVVGDLARRYFTKDKMKAGALSLLSLGGLVLLYGSHSRSAWIGFIIALGVYTLLSVPTVWQKRLVGIGLVGVIAAGVLVFQLRDTSFVQNVILHDNPEIGPAVTSNSARVDAFNEAIEDISERPLLGCGPGCAGPASFYDPDGIVLAENYYLQVAQEVGVVGLMLFVGIVVLVALRLFELRADSLALALLASLVGLSVANMLLHVWADDTLAYVWWGLAGYMVVQSAPKPARNRS